MDKSNIVSQINKVVEHATWYEMRKQVMHGHVNDVDGHRLRAIVYNASDVMLADAIDKLIEKIK